MLARTGNLVHEVHRTATPIQNALAVFNAYAASGDWEIAKNQACMGQPPTFAKNAHHYKAFVSSHAGGSDGKYLFEIEQYERMLGVKRQIKPADLSRLSEIDMPEAPRYVPAMYKAMLSCPSSKVSNGYADLFSSNDISSLKLNGENRKLAGQANDLMLAAKSFLDAYCKLPPPAVTKLTADMEVRCVMYVHSINADTRVSFKSLLHVAVAMYDEAKLADPLLPKWNKLEGHATVAIPAQLKIKELREDGKIPNSELSSMGFKVGEHIFNSTAEADQKQVFKIVSMDDELNITLQATNQGGSEWWQSKR